MKTLTPDELRALSQEVKQALTDLYGDRLEKVILYGSYARGDFHEDSDVDYLVVLRDDIVRGGLETRRMSSITGKLSLNYEVEVSVFPVSASIFSLDSSFFYKNIKQESIYL